MIAIILAGGKGSRMRGEGEKRGEERKRRGGDGESAHKNRRAAVN